MREAIPCFLGEHDFSSFQAAACDAEHAVRKVYRTSLEQRGELLVYTIEATALLRHMVRNIVGTLVEVGRGLRTAESFMNYWKRAIGPKRARRAAAWVVLS